ncbi:MAG: LysR family transcriptional regulator [Oscillospiraceae bacterium]|nr:LysR family transcriptional regulator [Oscillospiraceae bacterium]
MVEIKQLRQLVTIAECGTMTAAAKKLYLSQPALSRSMQRLESALSVNLFDHGQNSARLNETGRLAVEHAGELLRQIDALPEQLRAFARSLKTVSIGASAPAPLRVLTEALRLYYPEMIVASVMTGQEELSSGLLEDRFQLILVEKPPQAQGVLARKYVTERICLSVQRDHPLAGRESVSLADLAGLTILGYENIGRWALLHHRLHDTRLIIEKDPDVRKELIIHAALPAFLSNMNEAFGELSRERVPVPIDDEEASADFYLCAKESGEAFLDRLSPSAGVTAP